MNISAFIRVGRWLAGSAGWVGGLVLASASLGGELLTNPGFESGLTGWSIPGGAATLTLDAFEPRGGDFSALTSGRSATWQGPRQHLPFLQTGMTYSLSGWVRLASGGPASVRLTIKKTDADGTLYYSVGSVSATADRWSRIEGTYPHQARGTVSSLYLYFEGPPPELNFRVDDVSVVAQPLPVIQTDPTATLQVGRDFQEIRGFGAAGAYYQSWLCAHPQKAQILAMIFGDLGLDIYRIRNTYGVASDFQAEVAYLKEILAAAQTSLGRPVRLLNSSWSPPAWLKSNGSTSGGGTLARNGWGDYRYADFGVWWADSLLAYRAQGVVFDYISIQNEPDYAALYDSCRLDPLENDGFAGYGRAAEAVRQALAYRVPKPPRLIGPETLSLSSAGAYLSALSDPSVLDVAAHHLYGPGSFDQPDGMISAMRTHQAAHAVRPIFQTEYARLAGGDGFRGALNLARHIHNSLVENQVSAYIHWSLFWPHPTNGTEGYALVHIDNPWKTAAPGFSVSPQYYAFRQYSKFIDEGWHRVGATSGMSAVRISAFRSADTGRVAAVLIHDATSALTGFALHVTGFTVKTGEIYRTRATENGVRVGSWMPGQSMTLPAESITTLVLERAPDSPTTPAGGSDPATVRIRSIILTTVLKSGLRYGQARVALADGADQPVAGVRVTGYFGGDFDEVLTNHSDSAGWAVLNTLHKTPDPRFRFQVLDVFRDGYAFDADESPLDAEY